MPNGEVYLRSQTYESAIICPCEVVFPIGRNRRENAHEYDI
ncbi:MAG: hypothetical protein [Podoviridae sp. ctLUJ1]|nr:MAG: hypothetical protein [Podoviridae sp. ctLUJ1]